MVAEWAVVKSGLWLRISDTEHAQHGLRLRCGCLYPSRFILLDTTMNVGLDWMRGTASYQRVVFLSGFLRENCPALTEDLNTGQWTGCSALALRIVFVVDKHTDRMATPSLLLFIDRSVCMKGFFWPCLLVYTVYILPLKWYSISAVVGSPFKEEDCGQAIGGEILKYWRRYSRLSLANVNYLAKITCILVLEG